MPKGENDKLIALLAAFGPRLERIRLASASDDAKVGPPELGPDDLKGEEAMRPLSGHEGGVVASWTSR